MEIKSVVSSQNGYHYEVGGEIMYILEFVLRDKFLCYDVYYHDGEKIRILDPARVVYKKVER